MKSNDAPLQKWINRKHKIDELLTRLQDLSGDQFNLSPDQIHYGHVGDLALIETELQAIVDRCFKEGEHAN